jgi:hypothetical protein
MPREVLLIGGLTVLAAIVRFVALGTQSYWYDESLTVHLLRWPFGDMLARIPRSGAEPPLYFLLAWFWTRAFGLGEAGLRSLSAVFGTLTVPVAYLAARELIGRRGAVIIGLFAAFSPALVWYSQEARSYALMTLLCALSFLFFTRALRRPSRREPALWALASALALTAHYFAIFLVAPEAAWLLLRATERRRAAWAVGALALAGAALAPLALYQRTHGGVEWIGRIPLGPRLTDTGSFFVVGPVSPLSTTPVAVGAVLVLAGALGLVLGGRQDARVRRGVLLAFALGAAVIVIPLVIRLAGSDFFLGRNLLAAWLPLSIVLAAALALPRAGRVGLAVVAVTCAGFVAIDAHIAGTVEAQRDDWRTVGRILGPAREARVIEVAPAWQTSTLILYTSRLVAMPPTARVAEVDTVLFTGARAYNEPVRVEPPGRPFRRVGTINHQHMVVTRYRASRPTLLRARRLIGTGNNTSYPFLQAVP